jgi:hypothetical protein
MAIVSWPNIVWLLVDGVRRYPTDQDYRGKLPMMERFGEHSIEFLNVVTSAPSTIMSISAMMTGLPSYFLARNYDDFRFDNHYFVCLNDILKRRGYVSYAFLRGQETREKFRSLVDPVPRKYWAPHLRHGYKWANQDLNLVLSRVLEAGIPHPAFLFFHYNPHTPRIDPETSDTVEAALCMMIEAGFTYENTIYVLCSDHGFPDPSTGITTEWEIQNRLSHDLVLTDDNIMIPLYIRYPGCQPQRIETTTSSLDIMPTLLDLAGIGVDPELRQLMVGQSLLPLLRGQGAEDGDNRFFRCDARLLYQTGRVTAIRNETHKYVRFHDRFAIPQQRRKGDLPEAFYELTVDPLEQENLVVSTSEAIQEKMVEFRRAFHETERKAFSLQVDYLLSLFEQRASRERFGPLVGRNGSRLLLALEPRTGSYGAVALEVLARAYPRAQIDIFFHNDHQDELDWRGQRTVYLYQLDQAADGYRAVDVAGMPGYDLILVIVLNPADPAQQKLIRLSRQLDAAHVLVLDCNMNLYRRRRYWYYRLRALWSRTRYFWQEPSLLWRELQTDLRFVRRQIALRLGRHERWTA